VTSTRLLGQGPAAAALKEVGEPPGGWAPTRRSRRRPLKHGLSAISNETREAVWVYGLKGLNYCQNPTFNGLEPASHF
jgi:hypothetical protein